MSCRTIAKRKAKKSRVRSCWITTWSDPLQGTMTATGGTPQTVKLLKELASRKILASSKQIGQPNGEACTYQKITGSADEQYGWEMREILVSGQPRLNGKA